MIIPLNRLYTLICKFFYICVFCVSRKNLVVLCVSSEGDIYANLSPIMHYLPTEQARWLITPRFKGFRCIIEDLANIMLLARALVIVVDVSNRYISMLSIHKPTQIVYIGHGGGVYKKMGYMASSVKSKDEELRLSRVHGKYDFVICTSFSYRAFVSQNYNLSIHRVLPLGLPRTDMYFKLNTRNIHNQLTKRFPMCVGKKILLYAPTFRAINGTRMMPSHFNVDLFNSQLGDQYCLALRSHPTISDHGINGKWLDFSSIELEKCLSFADVLVTDYSSILFDYAFFARPCLLFTPDIEDLAIKSRFWFTPQELLRGYVCNSQQELHKKLMNLDINAASRAMSNIWLSFMDACDGESSKHIADLIISMLKNSMEKK